MAFVNRAAFSVNKSYFSSKVILRQVLCTSCYRENRPKYQSSQIHTTSRRLFVGPSLSLLDGRDGRRWSKRVWPAATMGGMAGMATDGAQIRAQIGESLTTPTAVEYIPPPPVPPVEAVINPEHVLNALGEPTFTSLDLAHWTPPGLIQSALEYLHVDMGLPWWGAIMAGTLVLRCLVAPLVVKSQKNAAKLHNNMPTMTRLQERFTEARKGGNIMESARASNELMDFMKRNQINPLKNFIVPLAQVPIFISVFVGLRKLANLPVESFRDGGLWWFHDLTICDPYYILPTFTMLSFLATIEIGADGVAANQQGQIIKTVLRVMPFVIFPVIMNFPSALLLYWATSNAYSLCQVGVLKIPRIRDALGIERKTVHPKTEGKDGKKKGFVQGIKETMNNSKKMAEVEDRARIDSIRFKEAGMGPLVKTYKTDPTKRRTS